MRYLFVFKIIFIFSEPLSIPKNEFNARDKKNNALGEGVGVTWSYTEFIISMLEHFVKLYWFACLV